MMLEDTCLVIIDRLFAKTQQLLRIPDLATTRSETYLLRIQTSLSNARRLWLDGSEGIPWHYILYDIKSAVASIMTCHYMLVRFLPQTVADAMPSDWRELEANIAVLKSKIQQLAAIHYYEHHASSLGAQGWETCVELEAAALLDFLLDKIIELRLQSTWTRDEDLQFEDIHETLLSLNSYWQSLGSLQSNELPLLQSHIEHVLNVLALLELRREQQSNVNLQAIRKLSEIIQKKLELLSTQMGIG